MYPVNDNYFRAPPRLIILKKSLPSIKIKKTPCPPFPWQEDVPVNFSPLLLTTWHINCPLCIGWRDITFNKLTIFLLPYRLFAIRYLLITTKINMNVWRYLSLHIFKKIYIFAAACMRFIFVTRCSAPETKFYFLALGTYFFFVNAFRMINMMNIIWWSKIYRIKSLRISILIDFYRTTDAGIYRNTCTLRMLLSSRFPCMSTWSVEGGGREYGICILQSPWQEEVLNIKNICHLNNKHDDDEEKLPDVYHIWFEVKSSTWSTYLLHNWWKVPADVPGIIFYFLFDWNELLLGVIFHIFCYSFLSFNHSLFSSLSRHSIFHHSLDVRDIFFFGIF